MTTAKEAYAMKMDHAPRLAMERQRLGSRAQAAAFASDQSAHHAALFMDAWRAGRYADICRAFPAYIIGIQTSA